MKTLKFKNLSGACPSVVEHRRVAIDKLRKRIKHHDACVAIIGLGYVGLPLSIRFTQEGFKTIGFDIDKEKVDMLNSGKSYIKHIKGDDIIAMAQNSFTATTNFSEISNVDVIIICVPTPLDVQNEPDLSFINGTLENIKPYLKENQLLILESTTYPGTTEEVLVPFIESIPDSSLITHHSSLFTIGENFFIGYSPEREDPGNKNYTTKTIPKIVSGYTKHCLELVKTLYDQIINQTVSVSSPRVAEMSKILENIYRSVNIGLVNELKMVTDKMNISIHEVIAAASTKPFGFTPFYPGPGVGGHCIPIDPFYFTWKAKQLGVNNGFIELAGKVNTRMPEWVSNKVEIALSETIKTLKDSKILILGVAYKKNIDDIRESPALRLIELFEAKGAIVDYHDPYVPELNNLKGHKSSLLSINVKENIKNYDAVLLVTDHDDFDYNFFAKESQLLIDTRGYYRNNKMVIQA